ncbi:MAG: DUF1810 domain-containing protein [Spirochaetales bacterium]|nr:DUF1810 domain-containing protein [Spirochaetales bacterium]
MADLSRFIKAQEYDYDRALREIRSGRKRSHWMWYIFPQMKQLGFSPTAQYYGIASLDEAKSYIADDTLRQHLVEISQALLALESDNASQIMGYPDDMKLRSCMTLFMLAAPDIDTFGKVLDKFYGGEKDEHTVRILNNKNME